MRISVLLAFVCLPLFAQANPPAEVDAALRARFTKFYQAHVDGKFRIADQLVAEDSKDFFFEMEKQRYMSFEAPAITYSDNFTKAKAVAIVTVELRVARMGPMIVKPPMTTYWKVENGEWCWYRIKETYLDTPFGRAKVPDDRDAELNRRAVEFKKISPLELVNQIKVSGSAVGLSSFQAASGVVTVTNNLPGGVTVDVTFPPVDGLTITVDKKALKTGESAKVLFDCKPTNSIPKSTITANIVVQPLNKTFPITVTFAVPRPARNADVNH